MPLWVHFWQRPTAKSDDANVPDRPSHAEYACTECGKRLPFSLMQGCLPASGAGTAGIRVAISDHIMTYPSSALRRDAVGRVVVEDGLQRTTARHSDDARCKLCKRRPALVCCRHTCSEGCRASAMLKLKSAPTLGQLQPESTMVLRSMPQKKAQVPPVEKVAMRFDQRMCDRLKKRIAHSREVTIFLSSPFEGLLEERAGLVQGHRHHSYRGPRRSIWPCKR